MVRSYYLIYTAAVAGILGVLIFNSSYFLMGMAVLGLLALACIHKKNLIFYLLLLLIPIDRFYFYVPWESDSFVKLKIYQLILIASIVLTFITFLVTKNQNRAFRWNLLDISILLMYLGRVASFFVSVDTSSYFKSIVLYGLFIAVYFYIRLNAHSVKPQKIIEYVIAVGMVYVVFGFLEFLLAKLGYGRLQISDQVYVYEGRPWSVFKEPDWFGGYLLFIIALTLPFSCLKASTNATVFRKKWILYAALLMSLIIVVRAAWLGLMVGVVVSFVILKQCKPIIASSITKVIAVLFVGLLFMGVVSFGHFKSVGDRFTSIFTYFGDKQYDAAVRTRLNSYEILVDYIKERTWTGYGSGAWKYLSRNHEHINSSLSANNLLLTPIFEMGLSGVLLYLLFFIALLKMLLHGAAHASDEEDLRYVSGIAIAVIGSLVFCVFSDIMLTGFYWAFLAVFTNYMDSLKLAYENPTHRS